MPSMTLFEGGLAPANDSAVVNKSISVPSWWLTWEQKKIIHLEKKHQKNYYELAKTQPVSMPTPRKL